MRHDSKLKDFFNQEGQTKKAEIVDFWIKCTEEELSQAK